MLLPPDTIRANLYRMRGLMDKASDFESEDCEFESRRVQKGKFSRCKERIRMGIVNAEHVVQSAATHVRPSVICLSLQRSEPTIGLAVLLVVNMGGSVV